MPLIVEDGTIVASANSYMTLVEANTYHTTRNNVGWTGADAVKEYALIKATDYIELRWGNSFLGLIEDEDQELSFPRIQLYDRAARLVEGIPQKLKNAQAEYALRLLSEDLFIEATTEESGQIAIMKREKIGPLETETRFTQGGTTKTTKSIPLADRWLLEYVNGSSVNGKNIRG